MRTILLLSLLALVSCNDPTAPLPKEYPASTPSDHGNGVYYFHCTGAKFAKSLGDFKASRPELEIVSICGNGTGPYGTDIGYFVVTSEK
jgi:hypothetical protein